jgi:hypothetical protein
MTDAVTTPLMRALHFITRQWWAGVLLLLLGGGAWFRTRGGTLTPGDACPPGARVLRGVGVGGAIAPERERLPLLVTATDVRRAATHGPSFTRPSAALRERKPELIQARPRRTTRMACRVRMCGSSFARSTVT